MKVTCRREHLLTACQMVASAAAARSTRPILTNLKVIAEDELLVLMATDMELGIRYELPGVTVTEPGMAILPPTRFIPILRETADEQITLNASREMTLIRLSSGRFELPGGEPEQFPDLQPFNPGSRYHEVTAGALRQLIRRTLFAVEKKESNRWAITGVLWEADAGQIRLVSTDTKRLAIAQGPCTIHGEPRSGSGEAHLVPVKAIQLLDKNLVDDGELVRVSLSSNEALFQTERALIHSRLVEGRFPPYREILPKKAPIRLELPVAEVFSRLRQAAIMTDDESKRVNFSFEPGKLTLRARGAETGSSEVELHLENYDGPTLTIGFDPAYLLEMLRAIENESTVILELSDDSKPAVFRLGDQYTYLVMPLGSA